MSTSLSPDQIQKLTEQIWSEGALDKAEEAIEGTYEDADAVWFLAGWEAGVDRFWQYVSEHGIPSSVAPPSQALFEHLSVLISDWREAKYADDAALVASDTCACDLERVLGAYHGPIVVAEVPALRELLEGWREYSSVIIEDLESSAYLLCALELEELIDTFRRPTDAPAAVPTSEGAELSQQTKNEGVE